MNLRIMILALLLCQAITTFAQEYEFVKDIPYREKEPMCNLDVAYLPNSNNCPVVVWFHGGGLTGGRKEVPTELLRDSIIVVGVEYRLSPNVTIDEIIDDAALSVAWTFQNISQYGGDPTKIFVAGHSAGGYLSNMISFDRSRLGKYGIDADSIAGNIPFSGQCITHFEARNRKGIPPLQPTIDSLAPLYHVRGDCSPILILSGDREKELYGRYEEQAYLWRMLQLTHHPDATLYELDGYDHSGMSYPGFPLLREFVRSHSQQ